MADVTYIKVAEKFKTVNPDTVAVRDILLRGNDFIVDWDKDDLNKMIILVKKSIADEKKIKIDKDYPETILK